MTTPKLTGISVLSNEQFIEGYLKPHILKCELEGLHMRQIVLEECLRRLEAKDNK